MGIGGVLRDEGVDVLTATQPAAPDVGIVLANAAVVTGTATPEELLGIAEVADSAPEWDYVWVGDSLLSVPRLESVVLLSACAARTTRIRLGVGCLVSLGFRDPLLFALQWSSLDVLSRGRVTLVACTGTSQGAAVEAELRAFGVDFATKVARMEEAIAFLRLASSSSTVTFAGDDIDVKNIELRPAFVQRPLPIWIVADPGSSANRRTLERVLSRVARLGDGWMTFGISADELRARIVLLHELLAEDGRSVRDRYPICAYVDVNVNPDESRALEDAVATCLQEGRRTVTREQLRESAAIGSAEQCAEFIARLVDVGVTNFALRPVSQRPREQAELLTEHLLPKVKALRLPPPIT
jgi:alkanesulfonate monooxygenase SsuD/methylene tetrahydromethanopterin reductase-like flavin-dependent oxidoreductase (luciferase family)